MLSGVDVSIEHFKIDANACEENGEKKKRQTRSEGMRNCRKSDNQLSVEMHARLAECSSGREMHYLDIIMNEEQ